MYHLIFQYCGLLRYCPALFLNIWYLAAIIVSNLQINVYNLKQFTSLVVIDYKHKYIRNLTDSNESIQCSYFCQPVT